jgi:hypothetical protein
MSEVEVLARVERGRKWARDEKSAALERSPQAPWSSRHDEGQTTDEKDKRQMTSDIFVEGSSHRGHIRVIGRSDYFALWIGDGCVDVSVPLTPASARVLAELLLAISAPEPKHTPSAV